MKIWMILYAGSQIGGTWGPLPYDFAECERRAATGNQITAQAADDPNIIAKMRANGVTAPLKDWRFVCERRQSRPALSDL